MSARRFALVTGATRGLGRRTALALAEAGLDVAITGRTVREGDGRVAARVAGDGDDVEVPGSLETTAREVAERGQRCLPLVMDLRSSESVRATAAEVLDTFVWWNGVRNQDFGYAAAAGLVKGVISLGLVLAANKVAHLMGEQGVYKK